MTLAECLSTLDGKPSLEADDALAVRRCIYGADAQVTREEVDALFKLNADAGALSPEWRALFIEAMVDFVVHQQHPAGYVDEVKADWLIASVTQYRRIREDELEMLIHVLEEADKAPARLDAFVLHQVKRYALYELDRRGRLDLDAVERLRRVLYAAGSEGNIQVTRLEAESLFDVNDAIKGREADPAWRELFVRAVADSVLFQTTWNPDAATELQDEAWLADTHMHPVRRLLAAFHTPAWRGGMQEGFREIMHDDYLNHDAEQDSAMHDAVERSAAEVTGEEAHWLLDRLGRGGSLDANEEALLAYLRANAAALDPALGALADKAAAA